MIRLLDSRPITLALIAIAGTTGCRGTQFARVIQPGQNEMVGSHQAGQETFRPLVDEAVIKLLGRHEASSTAVHRQVSTGPELLPPPKSCAVPVPPPSGGVAAAAT